MFFSHTLTWISHGCTCVPHPEPPSHLPPHPIPQGHPYAPALSTLSHASNLDWRSVSHMIIYMFQCYSLKSSHPCLLPQSPKDCSIHLPFFFFLILCIVAVQSLSNVRLFGTPWTAARQASLSFTISGVFSNSFPSSWWFYATISSSVTFFFFCMCCLLIHWLLGDVAKERSIINHFIFLPFTYMCFLTLYNKQIELLQQVWSYKIKTGLSIKW